MGRGGGFSGGGSHFSGGFHSSGFHSSGFSSHSSGFSSGFSSRSGGPSTSSHSYHDDGFRRAVTRQVTRNIMRPKGYNRVTIGDLVFYGTLMDSMKSAKASSPKSGTTETIVTEETPITITACPHCGATPEVDRENNCIKCPMCGSVLVQNLQKTTKTVTRTVYEDEETGSSGIGLKIFSVPFIIGVIFFILIFFINIIESASVSRFASNFGNGIIEEYREYEQEYDKRYAPYDNPEKTYEKEYQYGELLDYFTNSDILTMLDLSGDDYITDNVQWLSNTDLVKASMKTFREKTGYQPYLYICDSICGYGNGLPNDEAFRALKVLYDEVLPDQNGFLFVFMEYMPNYYNTYLLYGDEVAVSTYEENELYNVIDRLYTDSSLDDDHYFARIFEKWAGILE